jgi:hypothetical protein
MSMFLAVVPVTSIPKQTHRIGMKKVGYCPAVNMILMRRDVIFLMTKRKELSQLKIAMVEMDKRIHDLHHEQFALSEKVGETVCQIIFEEKLLAETKWELNTNNYSKLYLELKDCEQDPNYKRIFELIDSSNNCTFQLETGIQLNYFSDVSIEFDDNNMIPVFVRKNAMIIDGNNVTNKLHSHRRDVRTLETICHLFNIT